MTLPTDPRTDDRPLRGLLDPTAGQTRFVESLAPPAADLAELVRDYWSAQWDLRARDPYRVEVLAPPSVNLVIGLDRAWVQGVVRGRFTYLLEGQGRLFGVAFQPAGLRGFTRSAVASLTG